jgi:hypothetical protein
MRDHTLDTHCARPDTGTAETRHAVAERGRSDHMPASETLRGIADPTPISDRGFTTSAFDMAPSGITERGGVWIEWEPGTNGTFVAYDEALLVCAAAGSARAAVDAVHGAGGDAREQGDEGDGEAHSTSLQTNERKGQ